MLPDSEVEARRDPALWDQPETLDKLAILLTGNIVHADHGLYVEAERNYGLAKISLGLIEPPTFETGGNEYDPEREQPIEKVISSNGDQRAIVNDPASHPSNTYALFESGGTGTMVGWRIYTAGHVMFNNDWVTGANGWNCANGSTDNTAPICNVPGHPRWRFGGRINNLGTPTETITFVTPWTLCGYKNVPTGWTNLASTASNATAARWDYGFQNLDGCIPAGAGNVGWWVSDQATLRTVALWEAGYGGLVTCPAGRFGASQAAGDCPAGVIQTRPNLTTRPFTGGSIFWTGGTVDANLTATGGYLRTNQNDITPGHSGGAIIGWYTGTPAGWYAVGTTSNHNSTDNYFNLMTWEVQGFIYQ